MPFFAHSGAFTLSGGTTNRSSWPDQLDLSLLHQHHPAVHPLAFMFNDAQDFKRLDFDAHKRDVYALMVDSLDW